jgi:hypothetical protein
MSELYANCERMQDVFAQARREAVDAQTSRNLGAAEEHYRKMRDLVVCAVTALEWRR